jgi:DNA-binding LacI/PurR family transcriptional regulator
MFQGCAAVMQRANYHLIVAETAINARQRVADEAAQLRSLMDKGIRAMIIYAEPTDQNRALLEEALADGVYVVQIDRYLPGLPCDYVGIDNLSAAEEMMDHLLHVGHRRVAFLSVRPEPSSCQERLQGYRRALQLHGMPDADEDLIAFCDARKSVQGEIARILDRWLALPDPPTAIFASNDSLALFVMQALQQRQIAIPNEMALAGMDNLRVTSFVTPALTTVEQPFYEMGEVAAQLLLSRLAGAYEGEARRVMLPTRLIVRQSCGSAQAAPKRAGEIAFAGPREG